MKIEFIFIGIFVLVAATFLWRLLNSGSLTGAMLGGKINSELGVIPLGGGTLSSQKLKVMSMQSKTGEPFIALSVVSKAPLGASMMPFKLSRPQAQELIRLLQLGTSS